MKQFFFAVLMFVSISGFSKEIQIDSTFVKIRLNEFLEFSKIENNDDVLPWLREYKSISDIDRNEIHSSYWVKLTLNNIASSAIPMVFETPSFSIDNIEFYKLEQNQLNLFLEFKNVVEKKIESKFELIPGTHQYYVKVDFTKNTYINAELKTIKTFEREELLTLLLNALFYGGVLVIVLVNFILSYRLSDKLYQFYALWVLFYALEHLEMDGVLVTISNCFRNKESLKVILFTSALYFFIRFFLTAIKLKTNTKKGVLYIWILFVVEIFCALYFFYSNDLYVYKIWMKLNDLVVFWSYLLILFHLRSNKMAQLLAIAFNVLALCSLLYNISSEIILIDIGFTNHYLKIGVIVEMLVLTYAITYRFKNISEEKNKVEIEIEKRKALVEARRNKIFDDFVKEINLTKREIEILQYILKGQNNEEIASSCGIKLATVKYHNSNIFSKSGVNSREEIISKFLSFEQGYVS